MTLRQRDRSLGDGVYFAPEDYVGFGPRILILMIDALVVSALLFVLAFFWALIVGDFSRGFAWVAIIAVWLYLVPLKRSKTRTLGYRLLGCKLVTLQGTVPSLFMLTFRSLLWMLGPFNLLFDLVWCGIDEDRQTMRDRYSSTCLVKNSALPRGTGEVHLAYFNAAGYSFAYPHVVHPKAATP